jgi:hypothetical protein
MNHHAHYLSFITEGYYVLISRLDHFMVSKFSQLAFLDFFPTGNDPKIALYCFEHCIEHCISLRHEFLFAYSTVPDTNIHFFLLK